MSRRKNFVCSFLFFMLEFPSALTILMKQEQILSGFYNFSSVSFSSSQVLTAEETESRSRVV